MANEKRVSTRQALHRPALLTEVNGKIIGECMIVNISATGAKLTRLKVAELPDKFDLVLSKHGTVRRRCEVAWLSDDHIGVQFKSTPDPKQKT